MRKVLQSLTIILAVIFLVMVLPVSSIFVNADAGTEIYQVNGYNQPDIVYDSQGNVVHGYAYCLNMSVTKPYSYSLFVTSLMIFSFGF